MPRVKGPQNQVDGLAVVDDGEELVRSFFKLLGVNYDWREAPWVEADGGGLVKRLGYALELFRVMGGGLLMSVKPFVLTIMTPKYGVMLIKDGEWFYLASGGLKGASLEVVFIKARGNYLELTAPDALSLLFKP